MLGRQYQPFTAPAENTFHDEFGKKDIYDDNRENREGDHHINLSHVKLQEVCTTELCDQYRKRFFLVGVKYKCRNKIVVPALYKGENSLYCNSRFHKRKYDGIEGSEFTGAVNTGSFYKFQRKVTFHILFHIKESNRGCDTWYNQWDESVIQVHFAKKLQETESSYLSRDHHDCKDKGKHEFLAFEVVGMDGVSCHCREICTENSRTGCNKNAVEHTVPYRKSSCKKIFPVFYQMTAGNGCKSSFQGTIGYGYFQYVQICFLL